jgi:DNA-directed RNA polymerase subunit F
MSTRETAKKAVEEIAAKFGYVDSAILDRIGEVLPVERRIIEQVLLAKDQNIGHSIKTFVTCSTESPATQGFVC